MSEPLNDLELINFIEKLEKLVRNKNSLEFIILKFYDQNNFNRLFYNFILFFEHFLPFFVPEQKINIFLS
jgi:hypothetical protein